MGRAKLSKKGSETIQFIFSQFLIPLSHTGYRACSGSSMLMSSSFLCLNKRLGPTSMWISTTDWFERNEGNSKFVSPKTATSLNTAINGLN